EWCCRTLRATGRLPAFWIGAHNAVTAGRGGLMGWLHRLDRLIAGVINGAQWLALPLIVLLFLQWPLRDIFRSYSREANDFGQILFALLVAASVTAATRAGTHLAADAVAQRYSARARHYIWKIGTLAGLVPWALFILITSKPIVAH